jgi:hypothetical protein
MPGGGAKWKDVFAAVVLCLTCFLVMAWARPQYGADPMDYANVAFASMQRPGLVPTSEIWEFGHLVWRPLAVATTLLANPYASRWGIEPRLVPLAMMVALSAIFALLAVLLVYRIARLLHCSVPASLVVALLFLTTNSVLIYARSGYSYLPGVAMQLLAVSMILAPPAKRSRLWLRALGIGCALAASICFWTPYVVTVPGIIALAFLWEDGMERAERVRLAAHACLWTALATGFLFGGAILWNDFRSFGQIAQWVRESSHEWAQTHRLMRLATGLPRSFIAVQEESLLLKRLYFHDTYAPVSWLQVIAAVAWKPPLFALAMGALGWMLARTPAGRRLLVAGLWCWIPLIVFSVAVFEPGSPERFFPGFALLFAGLGYAAATRVSWRDPPGGMLAVFFAIMLAVNLASVSTTAAEARHQNAEQRLTAMSKVAHTYTLVVLLSYRDGIFSFRSVGWFHPLTRTLSRISVHFLDAIEPGTQRAPRFRQEFATAALNAWQRGGEVWISRRLVADRPRAEWDWVEGDSQTVRWRELTGFYRQFETDASTGGEDGFLHIPSNQANRMRLSASTASETRNHLPGIIRRSCCGS